MLTDTIADLSRKLIYLEPGETTVVAGVTLIDGTGAPPRPNATLVIEGDRIAAVGSGDGRTPTGDGVRRLDGTGLTALPGLIDCHVHFTGSRVGSAVERLTPDVWGGYRGLVALLAAAQALEGGFTTARHLGHGDSAPVYGLRRAVAEGLVPGPRILTSGWAISQTGGHGDPHFLPQEIALKYRPLSAFADGPWECRRMVRQNFGEGADLVKIYATEGSLMGERAVREHLPNFTVEEIRAMAEEAHLRGAKVAAHVQSVEGVRRCLLGGVDTIEHGGRLGDAPEVLAMMVERGAFLVPTMTVLDAMVARGAAAGIKAFGLEAARRLLEHQQGYLRRALDMGVKIAVGTDSGGTRRGLHARELVLLVAAGFTPMQAIVAATRTAAAALGLERDLGTLAPGKVGEMVILAGDPLADIGVVDRKENIRWILKSRSQLT